jgi:hypothetical protein
MYTVCADAAVTAVNEQAAAAARSLRFICDLLSRFLHLKLMAARASSFPPHFWQSCGLFLLAEFRGVFQFNFQTASSFIQTPRVPGLLHHLDASR